MKKNDLKLYEAFIYLLKNKEQINVSSLSKKAEVDRSSVYFRLKS